MRRVPWDNLRAAAEAMQRGRLLVLVYMGLGLVLLGLASSWPVPLGWYLAASVGLLTVVAMVLLIRDGRAADWLLTTYEGEGEPEP